MPAGGGLAAMQAMKSRNSDTDRGGHRTLERFGRLVGHSVSSDQIIPTDSTGAPSSPRSSPARPARKPALLANTERQRSTRRIELQSSMQSSPETSSSAGGVGSGDSEQKAAGPPRSGSSRRLSLTGIPPSSNGEASPWGQIQARKNHFQRGQSRGNLQRAPTVVEKGPVASDRKKRVSWTRALVVEKVTVPNSSIHLWCCGCCLAGRNASCRQRSNLCGEGLKKFWTVVLTPEGKFRRYWDLVVCLAVVYIAVILPLEISFWSNNLSADPTKQVKMTVQWQIVKLISYFITVIFLLDIYFEMKTAFSDEITGELVIDRRRMCMRYARRPLGLVFDVATSLPFTELIEPFLGQGASADAKAAAQSTLRLVNALKILRLVRIIRLLRYMDRHLNVNKGIVSMIKVRRKSRVVAWAVWRVNGGSLVVYRLHCVQSLSGRAMRECVPRSRSTIGQNVPQMGRRNSL